MARFESKKKMLEWQRTQRQGRKRISRATSNLAVRSVLFRESFLPVSTLGAPTFQSCDTDAITSQKNTPIPLPSFLSSIPASNSSQVTSGRGFSFLDFPAEVRNLIYKHAAEYPTCRTLFDSYYKQKENGTKRTGRGTRVKLYTPTVLLLCKQVTREALTILRSRPFVIDHIPPWIFGHSLPLPITDFISVPTLQNIPFFEFKVTLGEGSSGSGRIWRRVLRSVFEAWSQRNSVARLRVMFKIANLGMEPLWYSEIKDYEMIVDNINNFEFRHAAKPATVQYEHWIIDHYYAYRTGFRNPLIRMHPDRDIWQGSIMEYV